MSCKREFHLIDFSNLITTPKLDLLKTRHSIQISIKQFYLEGTIENSQK